MAWAGGCLLRCCGSVLGATCKATSSGAAQLHPPGKGIPAGCPCTGCISFWVDQTDLIKPGHKVSCYFLQFSRASTRNKRVFELRCSGWSGWEACWGMGQYARSVTAKGRHSSEAGLEDYPGKGKKEMVQAGWIEVCVLSNGIFE